MEFKEKLFNIIEDYELEEYNELEEGFRMTPLRRFIKLIGYDPKELSQEQKDKIADSARYKQWITTKRILKKAKESNKKNPHLKNENIDEREMSPQDKEQEKELKDKYDKSEMYDNMVKKYGEKKGEQIYFAYIRKKAMKEDVIEENKYAGWTAKDLHNYVTKLGFIQDSGSKHQGYIHKKTGVKIKPIPRHKGDLAPGTVKGIIQSVTLALENPQRAMAEDYEPVEPTDYQSGKNYKDFRPSSSKGIKIYKRRLKTNVKASTNLLPTSTLKSKLINKGFSITHTGSFSNRGRKRGFMALSKDKIKVTKGTSHYTIPVHAKDKPYSGFTANKLRSIYQKESVNKVEKILRKSKDMKNKEYYVTKTMTGEKNADIISVNPVLDNSKK